ncbi:zinc-ribbon domain-containing protein [Rhodovulum euryhalinum]|uniref:Putative Zn finger-like uncharacterized protein n=1 Tax=Rhodovulum euryhalinum TaxID=35805 RepID=A0A4R2KDX1_9RHOB|nr:zinc-ribbon domain-containing protein [Rhodovulum euryhalinum]TCO71164.1 putative Zn finger-like uncharacterized protein [Rhodovulum euryhalinum]
MRLICPNCEAQYEVDDAVIPDEGRDVQCSNCGQTWFQLPAGSGAPAATGTEAAGADAPAIEPEDVGWHEETAAAPGSDTKAEPEEDEAPAPEAASAAGPRRTLDASVLSILKEEAEREQRARQEEAAIETFSSQPDLGLDNAPAERPAPTPEPGPARPVAAPAPSAEPRRDLLPDIEEINSTLKASSDRGADSIVTAEDQKAEERSAFRKGFGLVVLAAVLALAAYLLAPTIAGLDPALDGPMTAYVGAIDAARVWINTAVSQAVDGVARALQGDG